MKKAEKLKCNLPNKSKTSNSITMAYQKLSLWPQLLAGMQVRQIIPKDLSNPTIGTASISPHLRRHKRNQTYMPSPSEIQAMLPLFFQLLFFAVAGALLVGVFFSIVGWFFRNAIIIMIIVALLFAINYGYIDLTKLFGAVNYDNASITSLLQQ